MLLASIKFVKIVYQYQYLLYYEIITNKQKLEGENSEIRIDLLIRYYNTFFEQSSNLCPIFFSPSIFKITSFLIKNYKK